MSAKRRTTALVSGVARWAAMASDSAGLELPATSLIAPLLGRIAVSWLGASRALITSGRRGWQYGRRHQRGIVPEFPHGPVLAGHSCSGAKANVAPGATPGETPFGAGRPRGSGTSLGGHCDPASAAISGPRAAARRRRRKTPEASGPEPSSQPMADEVRCGGGEAAAKGPDGGLAVA